MYKAMKKDFYIKDKKEKYYVGDRITVKATIASRIDGLVVKIMDRDMKEVKFRVERVNSD